MKTMSSKPFCVQFFGTESQTLTKNKILHPNSGPEDIRMVWGFLYDSEPASSICIIVEKYSRYLLEDRDDFKTFMLMARDHYSIHPSKPIRALLASSTYDFANESLLQPSTSAYLTDVKRERSYSSSHQRFNRATDQPAADSATHAQSSGSMDISHDQALRRNFENPDVPQDLSLKNRPLASESSLGRSISRPQFPPTRELVPTNPAFGIARSPLRYPFVSRIPTNPEAAASAIYASLQHTRFLNGNPAFLCQSILQNYHNSRYSDFVSRNPFLMSHNSLTQQYPDQGSTSCTLTSSNKARKRRRKFNETEEIETSKRIRGSSEQSNIQHHYQKAILFMEKSEEEQKAHNSAHRSHWKHLLSVVEKDSNFLERHKNSKYDEWSSEARDIFAICKPKDYKWSFLTLTKHGDNLCRRLKETMKSLMEKKPEDRPIWCPPNDTLQFGIDAAEKRFKELQKIKETRSSDEVNRSSVNNQINADFPKSVKEPKSSTSSLNGSPGEISSSSLDLPASPLSDSIQASEFAIANQSASSSASTSNNISQRGSVLHDATAKTRDSNSEIIKNGVPFTSSTIRKHLLDTRGTVDKSSTNDSTKNGRFNQLRYPAYDEYFRNFNFAYNACLNGLNGKNGFSMNGLYNNSNGHVNGLSQENKTFDFINKNLSLLSSSPTSSQCQTANHSIKSTNLQDFNNLRHSYFQKLTSSLSSDLDKNKSISSHKNVDSKEAFTPVHEINAAQTRNSFAIASNCTSLSKKSVDVSLPEEVCISKDRTDCNLSRGKSSINNSPIDAQDLCPSSDARVSHNNDSFSSKTVATSPSFKVKEIKSFVGNGNGSTKLNGTSPSKAANDHQVANSNKEDHLTDDETEPFRLHSNSCSSRFSDGFPRNADDNKV